MNLAYAPPPRTLPQAATTRGERAGDRYVLWLGAVLLGYALFSRGFAYLGLPPLFIGEIMILFGLGALARAGRVGPLFAQPAAWLMAALVVLAAVRTVPYTREYGLDAVRDFMMIGYAVYAVILGGLVVARPARLVAILEDYRSFAVAMVCIVWVVYLVFKTSEASVPLWPWASTTHVFEAKAGDIMVHLGAITAFVILGLTPRKPWLMLALALNTAIVIASSRGGMLSYVACVGVAYALRPPEARVGRLVYAFAFLLALGIIAGPVARINDGSRAISVDQIVLNIKSVLGQGDEALDGTKKWRLEWWTKIVDYTVFGPYFWEGRGFGVNLAREDGFDVIPELRSPHNGHMTVLARMGVPGAALWLAMLAAWFGSLFLSWLSARRAGRHRWMALFAFLLGYMLAIHVNAAFDVFLEGPMGGIWFWSIFGLGLAARSLYRTCPELLSDTNAPLQSDAPAALHAPIWDWTDAVPGTAAASTAVARAPAWQWGDVQPHEWNDAHTHPWNDSDSFQWADPPTRPARPQPLPKARG